MLARWRWMTVGNTWLGIRLGWGIDVREYDMYLSRPPLNESVEIDVVQIPRELRVGRDRLPRLKM